MLFFLCLIIVLTQTTESLVIGGSSQPSDVAEAPSVAEAPANAEGPVRPPPVIAEGPVRPPPAEVPVRPPNAEGSVSTDPSHKYPTVAFSYQNYTANHTVYTRYTDKPKPQKHPNTKVPPISIVHIDFKITAFTTVAQTYNQTQHTSGSKAGDKADNKTDRKADNKAEDNTYSPDRTLGPDDKTTENTKNNGNNTTHVITDSGNPDEGDIHTDDNNKTGQKNVTSDTKMSVCLFNEPHILLKLIIAISDCVATLIVLVLIICSCSKRRLSKQEIPSVMTQVMYNVSNVTNMAPLTAYILQHFYIYTNTLAWEYIIYFNNIVRLKTLQLMITDTVRELFRTGQVRLTWILLVCEVVWLCLVVSLTYTIRKCDLCSRSLLHCLTENLLVALGLCGVSTVIAMYNVLYTLYKSCHRTVAKYRKIPAKSPVLHDKAVASSGDVVDNTVICPWLRVLNVTKLFIFVLQMVISLHFTFGFF